MRQTATAVVRLDEGKATSSSTARRATRRFGFEQRQLRSNFVAARLDETENHAQQPGNLGNVGSRLSTSCFPGYAISSPTVSTTAPTCLTSSPNLVTGRSRSSNALLRLPAFNCCHADGSSNER